MELLQLYAVRVKDMVIRVMLFGCKALHWHRAALEALEVYTHHFTLDTV